MAHTLDHLVSEALGALHLEVLRLRVQVSQEQDKTAKLTAELAKTSQVPSPPDSVIAVNCDQSQ